ncbi:MAG: TetR/AcrR family transcriptional regulator [Archangiaceae bacterium]|nr:TetR/AcrR family transcriptional regulator [Archangiaceae bacterium]
MTATTRDKQREESKERLFHAAIEIFRRDGFRAARVDDITFVAGLSRTSFYFHFPTKDDVLIELNRRLEEPVVRRLEALDEAMPIAQVLAEVAEQLATQWREHRTLVIDAMTTGLRVEAERFREARQGSLREALGKVFERSVKKGEVQTTRAPAMLGEAYLLNCLAALTMWGSGAGEDDGLKTSLQSAGELFLRGALNCS